MLGSKFESRLFGKKKSTPSKNRAMKWKSSFWREKVDFFKTPGDKIIGVFGAEKYVCTYTRV